MSSFQDVCISAISYVLPEEVVTSEQIEIRLHEIYERFGLRVGRLELMTGIRERRFWSAGTMPSEASTRAGRLALHSAEIDASQIEYLIHAAVSRDFLEPATASVVHHNLGLSPQCAFVDLSNACLGFLNGLIDVGNRIELGQIKHGLVVAGESSRQLVESTLNHLVESPSLTKAQLKQAFASLTIGSGSAAAVLSHRSESPTAHRLAGWINRVDTSCNHLCQGQGDSSFGAGASMLMNTNAESLLGEGCALAARTWDLFLENMGWQSEQVDRFFTHQVGVAHRDRLYESLKLDPKRDYTTVEFLGNMGSVSLPVTMALGVESNPPCPGDRIALLGIGSGLSCCMLGLEW